MVGSDPEDDYAFIAGEGDYAIEVVSGARHQERLEWLAQGRGEEPAEYACTALLVREPDNPSDSNAVSVSVHGVRVGYLPADAAVGMAAAMGTYGFDRAACEAIIEGGWYRSADDKGDFCVRLDLNPDFAPESVAMEDRPASEPVSVVVTASARKTAFDLGLGAIGTVAMLVLIGFVWLFGQQAAELVWSDRHAAVSPMQAPASTQRREAALQSPDIAREKMRGVALANQAGTPGRSGEMLAVSTDVRSDAKPVVERSGQPRPVPLPSTARSSDLRPKVTEAETVTGASALPPVKLLTVLSPAARGVAAAHPPRAQVAARTAGTLADRVPSEMMIDRERGVMAVLLATAEEAHPVLDRKPPFAAAAAAPLVQEVDPSTVAVIFQSALPPIPQPAPPQATAGRDRGSGDEGRRASTAAGESRNGKASRAAARIKKRAARADRRRRGHAKSRTEARAARVRARSRYSVRHRRRKPPPVPYREGSRVEALSPAPSSPPAPVPPPFNEMAIKMLNGWTKEWSQNALRPLVARPRPPQ